jgi:hypothetical protein
VHLFKGKYFLYASKSGGYWYSDDMQQWIFRPSATLPVEDYAPTVEKNKLWNSVMIYDKNELELHGLNKEVPYFFRVNTFNENGIARGKN